MSFYALRASTCGVWQYNSKARWIDIGIIINGGKNIVIYIFMKRGCCVKLCRSDDGKTATLLSPESFSLSLLLSHTFANDFYRFGILSSIHTFLSILFVFRHEHKSPIHGNYFYSTETRARVLVRHRRRQNVRHDQPSDVKAPPKKFSSHVDFGGKAPPRKWFVAVIFVGRVRRATTPVGKYMKLVLKFSQHANVLGVVWSFRTVRSHNSGC